MYINIGQDKVICTRNIVAVCDLDKASLGRDTRRFLKLAQEGGKIVLCTEDIPVSFIVCCDGTTYLTPLNVQTLKKRI